MAQAVVLTKPRGGAFLFDVLLLGLALPALPVRLTPPLRVERRVGSSTKPDLSTAMGVVHFMDRSLRPFDRQPQATAGNPWSQRPLNLLGSAPPPAPAQELPGPVLHGASFSSVLQFAAQHSGFDDHELAAKVYVCAGYFSRFMRGVGQQWAKRLVLFMQATNSLAPLQWMAEQMGCELVLRDRRAAEVAALNARLRELERGAA